MNSRVFAEWLGEKRKLRALEGGKRRVIYIENASGLKLMDATKDKFKWSSIEIRFLPKNATDLFQPADSFSVKKIKTVWRRKWDEKRFNMIEKEEWVDWKEGSRKISNPGENVICNLQLM